MSQWEEIKVLFFEAMELDPCQRLSFVKRACVRDPSMRLELETLIASVGQEEDFLETPALEELRRQPHGTKIEEGNF